MKRYHHFGLPVEDNNAPLAEEIYFEAVDLTVNNPLRHPMHVEWLKFGPNFSGEARLQTEPHICYEVDDLEAHIAGKTIFRPAGDMGDPPFARQAFTEEDGILTEYIQYTHPTRRWFDDPA